MLFRSHGEWAAFRTTLRAVARLEPAIAKALKSSRAKQLDLLASATGLHHPRHRAALMLVLAIVERLAETALEGEAAMPPVRRDTILEQAERALLALIQPGEQRQNDQRPDR